MGVPAPRRLSSHKLGRAVALAEGPRAKLEALRCNVVARVPLFDGFWPAEDRRRAFGFKVPPRRWVVERTLAWLNRNRRLAKGFEATIASAEAWIMIAAYNS